MTSAPKSNYCDVAHGGLEVSQHNASEDKLKEQSGLQVIPQHDAPEAYNHEAPEVSISSQLRAPLERKSSLAYPEALDDQGHGKPGFHSYSSHPPSPENLEHSVDDAPYKKRGRRWCGMRTKTFAIVMIVAVILIVGAIVGGVLGATLPSNDNVDSPEVSKDSQSEGVDTVSNTDSNENTDANSTTAEPLSVQNMSGFATAWLEGRTETLLAYYQDESGAIIENRFNNGEWLLDASNVNDSIVVSPGAAADGSPISAVSYRYGGKIFRQVFFQDSEDRLMTSNVTGAASFETWSEPHNVLDKHVRPGNIALAACVEPTVLSTINVFYGSNSGSIWQAYWSLNDTGTWAEGARLKGSEDRSGVACHVSNGGSRSSLEVFYSNVDLHLIARTSWTQVDQGDEVDGGWVSEKDETATIGSDLAFAAMGEDSGYLFYQNERGDIRRGFIGTSTSMLQGIQSLRSAANGTKLAAAFVDDDTIYMAQNSSGTTEEFVFSAGLSGYEATVPANNVRRKLII